jgi:hypothetical protein
MHFLGTSKLEWAVLLTVIQRNIRKYVNPQFTISFDCASPFLATANGQVYFENVFPNNGKWSYRMAPVLDDKKYAKDTRKWKDGLLADIKQKDKNSPINNWQDSPISDMLTMKDICIYGPGVPKAGVTLTEENFKDPELYDVLPDVNKNGKWGKTSWDSFSYALLMGHNVWLHLTAVQEANRRFDAGEHPAMMRSSGPGGEYFEDIVEAIFATPDRSEAEAIIEKYTNYWMEIVGTRGFKGKKALNSQTMFGALFEVEGDAVEDEEEHHIDDSGFDETKLDHLGEE